MVEIPDDNFKYILLHHEDFGGEVIDTNGDGKIQQTEAEAITKLVIGHQDSVTGYDSHDVSDLTGIEAFVNLIEFYGNYNNLSSLNLSQNPNIEILHCTRNQLTSLDVSNNPKLSILVLTWNHLYTFAIDLSNNSSLEYLDLGDNPLFHNIDLSNNPRLKYLDLRNCAMSYLDLSNNPELRYLDVNSNSLTSLDVSNNSALEYLNLRLNGVTQLNLSDNPNLRGLYLKYNELTSLDVSNNLELQELNVSSNQLTSLDLSNNLELQELKVNSNALTSLDLSNNPALYKIDCSGNGITSLDLSNNPALYKIDCSGNGLAILDLRNGNNQKLNEFDAEFNPNLTCIFVDDAAYSIANWEYIDPASNFVETQAQCEQLPQIVQIPDDNFKYVLLHHEDFGGEVIDTNGDGEIQYIEARYITDLYVGETNNKYAHAYDVKNLTGGV